MRGFSPVSGACRCSTDGHHPAVDLEDAALVARLFALFHGTPEGSPGVLPAERATPAGAALQARLMGMFTRSAAAANAFPAVLQARPAQQIRACVTLREDLYRGCCRQGLFECLRGAAAITAFAATLQTWPLGTIVTPCLVCVEESVRGRGSQMA